jgi:hypothetical protein
MQLHAFREQAFAAALATARKSRAAASCFHAGPKTMLAFACSFGGLVSAFHKTENPPRRDLKALNLGLSAALSTLLRASIVTPALSVRVI